MHRSKLCCINVGQNETRLNPQETFIDKFCQQPEDIDDRLQMELKMIEVGGLL